MYKAAYNVMSFGLVGATEYYVPQLGNASTGVYRVREKTWHNRVRSYCYNALRLQDIFFRSVFHIHEKHLAQEFMH